MQHYMKTHTFQLLILVTVDHYDLRVEWLYLLYKGTGLSQNLGNIFKIKFYKVLIHIRQYLGQDLEHLLKAFYHSQIKTDRHFQNFRTYFWQQKILYTTSNIRESTVVKIIQKQKIKSSHQGYIVYRTIS